MNAAAAAFERAMRRERQKAAVVRALAAWETWIIIVGILYLGAHVGYWSTLAFRVVGQ